MSATVWAVMVVLLCPHSARAAGHAVILQYHNFGEDTPPSTSVTMQQFESHLGYLEENGFTVWPVDRIVAYVRENKELPARCVGITIDDANISVYERAFPELKKRGLPFTVFVPTDSVDRGYQSSMSWEQMREMQGFGASFSSHSRSHAYLIQKLAGESEEKWRDRVREDLEISLRRLSKELGSGSNLFAYPYGEYNPSLKNIVTGMNLVGFSQQSGAVWAGSDFAALPRFPMASRYAGMGQFAEKVNSLPLPVLSAEPDNPVLRQGVSTPSLRLKLAPGDYRRDSLSCYADGQGEIRVSWKDLSERIVDVSAVEPLPRGRSRYNCTAIHREGGRYYWYSHLWIRNTEQ